MNNKSWRRVLSLLLSLLLVVGMMPFLTFASEELTKSTRASYSLSDADFNLSLSLEVNGVPVSANTRYRDGDTFKLSMAWNIPNSYNSPDNNYTYSFSDDVFDLNDVQGEMNNGKYPTDPEYVVYGAYSVSNNTLSVTYNEDFYNLNNRHSSLAIEGIINITEETITDDDGGYSFVIPGLSEYYVQLYTQNGIRIEKTGNKVVDNEQGKIYIDYSVKVTSVKNNTNVHVWDGLNTDSGTNDYLRITNITTKLNGEDYQGYENSEFLNPNTNIVNSSSYYRIAELDIPAMSVGDVFEITYRANYYEATNASNLPYGSRELTNLAKASSTENSEVTDTVVLPLQSSWLFKSGKHDEDMNIVWTITVAPGDFRSLQLKDEIGPNQLCPANNPVFVYSSVQAKTTNGATLIETINFSEIQNGHMLNWSEDDDTYRIIQFKTVPEEAIYWENTAKLPLINRQYTASVTGGSTSPTIVEKTLDSAEHVGQAGTMGYFKFRLFSTIEAVIGSEAASLGEDFYLIDIPFSNYTTTSHTYENLTSIKVFNEENQTWEDASDRFTVTMETYPGKTGTFPKFKFKNGNVIEGRYQIKLTSILNYSTMPKSDTIANYVYWKKAGAQDGETSWRAWWTFNSVSKNAIEIKNDQIVWKVGIPTMNNHILIVGTGRRVVDDFYGPETGTTVTDKLPAGLSFVCAAYDNSNPQPNCEGAVEPISITENNDGTTTLVFPIKRSSELYIRTKYDGDYLSLETSKTYTNNVQVDLRSAPDVQAVILPIMKASAKGTITPPKPISKNSAYTENTAPFVNYTVSLNESSIDLIPADAESQSYKIVDSLGSGLRFDSTSLLINGQQLSDFPYLTMTLTGNGFEIDGFLDEVAYLITYRAVVSLTADGTAIFPEGSAQNTLQIPDGYIPGGEITVITTESGRILKHNGASGGETA